jgi:hypothetical protein
VDQKEIISLDILEMPCDVMKKKKERGERSKERAPERIQRHYTRMNGKSRVSAWLIF